MPFHKPFDLFIPSRSESSCGSWVLTHAITSAWLTVDLRLRSNRPIGEAEQGASRVGKKNARSKLPIDKRPFEKCRDFTDAEINQVSQIELIDYPIM